MFFDSHLAWLESTLTIASRERYDVLFRTQEQVAVLARCHDQLASIGLATVVPSFDALARVQDKLSAFATLSCIGLAQPESTIVRSAAELRSWDHFPVFVKLPIGTATAGVWHVGDRDQLSAAAQACAAAGAFNQGGVLVQQPVAGPLVMIQSVFAHGTLVAAHANLRVREGAGGGASHKQSLDLPVAREHLRMLGEDLRWHGALSADAILTPEGPVYIGMNPRLVEPGNAWRADVDLVGRMLDLACGRTPRVQAPGRPGVKTHQLLLAVLGAA